MTRAIAILFLMFIAHTAAAKPARSCKPARWANHNDSFINSAQLHAYSLFGHELNEYLSELRPFGIEPVGGESLDAFLRQYPHSLRPEDRVFVAIRREGGKGFCIGLRDAKRRWRYTDVPKRWGKGDYLLVVRNGKQ